MQGLDTLAFTILSMLAGGLGVHAVNAIKKSLDLQGRWAFVASLLVAAVMATLSVVADGAVNGAVSAENVALYLTSAIIAMERYYNFLEFQTPLPETISE